jgi:hypothetical protein
MHLSSALDSESSTDEGDGSSGHGLARRRRPTASVPSTSSRLALRLCQRDIRIPRLPPEFPPPAAITTYCRPPTMEVLGVAKPAAQSGASHRSVPLAASKARNLASVVAAMKRTPPAVTNGPPYCSVPVIPILATSSACSPNGIRQGSRGGSRGQGSRGQSHRTKFSLTLTPCYDPLLHSLTLPPRSRQRSPPA